MAIVVFNANYTDAIAVFQKIKDENLQRNTFWALAEIMAEKNHVEASIDLIRNHSKIISTGLGTCAKTCALARKFSPALEGIKKCKYPAERETAIYEVGLALATDPVKRHELGDLYDPGRRLKKAFSNEEIQIARQLLLLTKHGKVESQ